MAELKQQLEAQKDAHEQEARRKEEALRAKENEILLLQNATAQLKVEAGKAREELLGQLEEKDARIAEATLERQKLAAAQQQLLAQKEEAEGRFTQEAALKEEQIGLASKRIEALLAEVGT